MNKISFFLLVCCVLPSAAQTSTPIAPVHLFCISRAELAPLVCEPDKLAPSASVLSTDVMLFQTQTNADDFSVFAGSEASSNSVPEEMSLSSRASEFNLQLYRRLDDGGHLTRPEALSENVLVRATDAIFRPEVVRIGKVAVSCSIITAIKRKNPLGLINPIFFNAAW